MQCSRLALLGAVLGSFVSVLLFSGPPETIPTELCKALKAAPSPAALARGRSMAEKIWRLDRSLGLNKEEWLKVCLFIEHAKKSCPKKRYFPKHVSGLPCKITKEPKLKGYLLSELPRGYLDSGWHKKVSKVILYRDCPKLLASCVGSKRSMSEVKIMRKLRSGRGIATFFGSVKHSHGKVEIWLEFFPDGNLLRKRGENFNFSHPQLIKIFKDISYGLRLMHKHRLVHRDLHFGNMLLRKTPNGLFDAALIDYGQASRPSAAGKKIPQLPGDRNPPELLLHSASKLNRYAADIYALGVNFYILFWGQNVPWAHLTNPRSVKKPNGMYRRSAFQQVVEKYEALKKEHLQGLLPGGVARAHEQVQGLILRMLDYNPSRRPSMNEVVKTLERITLKSNEHDQ